MSANCRSNTGFMFYDTKFTIFNEAGNPLDMVFIYHECGMKDLYIFHNGKKLIGDQKKENQAISPIRVVEHAIRGPKDVVLSKIVVTNYFSMI